MMKFGTFILGGLTYTIKHEEFVNNGIDFGAFDSATNVISIAKKVKDADGMITELSNEVQEATYWHELGHVFNYFYNTAYDEAFAQAFSAFMIELIPFFRK